MQVLGKVSGYNYVLLKNIYFVWKDQQPCCVHSTHKVMLFPADCSEAVLHFLLHFASSKLATYPTSIKYNRACSALILYVILKEEPYYTIFAKNIYREMKGNGF